MYVRCTYGTYGREITIHTVIYGVYIRFWPTLRMCYILPLRTPNYSVMPGHQDPSRFKTRYMSVQPCQEHHIHVWWCWPALQIILSALRQTRSYATWFVRMERQGMSQRRRSLDCCLCARLTMQGLQGLQGWPTARVSG
jgi:hypothetical protein